MEANDNPVSKLPPTEAAYQLLETLVGKIHLRGGERVPDQRVKQEFNRRRDELKAALKYASAQEWLTWDDSTGDYYLTDEGFKVASNL